MHSASDFRVTRTASVGNVTTGTVTGLISSNVYLVTVTPFSSETESSSPFGNISVSTSELRSFLISQFIFTSHCTPKEGQIFPIYQKAY